MSVAATRYAKALIDVLYPDKAESGLEQLEKFSALLSEQPEARQVLQNPTISVDRRKALLKEVGDALSFQKPIRNFVDLLVERNRMDLISEIVSSYQMLLDEKQGVVRAHVTTAYELDSAREREVAAKLKAITGRDVRLNVSTDKSLIGGIVAQVGSTIYDGSVRQQLRSFKNRLLND